MSIKHQSDVMLDGTVTFTGAPTSITATLYTASASATSFTSSATMVTVGTPYGYNVDLICVVSSQADKTRVKIAATATVNGVSETQWTTVRVIDASVTSRLASSAGLITLGTDYFGSGYIFANAIRLGGTSLTPRDIGASVLLSPGTGTGQLDVTAGVVKSNMVQIIASAITETTAGWIAAAFRKLFNVAAPVHTMASVDQTGDGYGVLSNGVSLTTAERDTLAGVIDARLLSAGDATDLIAGIVSRIGNTNVDQAAFVVAVKAALFDAGSIGNKLAVNGAGAVTFANTSIGSVTGSVDRVTQPVSLTTDTSKSIDDARDFADQAAANTDALIATVGVAGAGLTALAPATWAYLASAATTAGSMAALIKSYFGGGSKVAATIASGDAAPVSLVPAYDRAKGAANPSEVSPTINFSPVVNVSGGFDAGARSTLTQAAADAAAVNTRLPAVPASKTDVAQAPLELDQEINDGAWEIE